MAIKDIITKEQYAQIAETYCSEYGYLIENTQFYKTFTGLVPDLCLYCVNEPGAADRKEKEFRDGILAVYSEMKLLQMWRRSEENKLFALAQLSILMNDLSEYYEEKTKAYTEENGAWGRKKSWCLFGTLKSHNEK